MIRRTNDAVQDSVMKFLFLMATARTCGSVFSTRRPSFYPWSKGHWSACQCGGPPAEASNSHWVWADPDYAAPMGLGCSFWIVATNMSRLRRFRFGQN